MNDDGNVVVTFAVKAGRGFTWPVNEMKEEVPLEMCVKLPFPTIRRLPHSYDKDKMLIVFS